MGKPARIYGTLYPAGDRLGFDGPMEVVFDGKPVQLVVFDGRFQVRFIVGDDSDLQSLLNQLKVLVQALVDALSFHFALALTAEVEGGFIEPDTVLIVRQHRWPEAVGQTWDTPIRIEAEQLEPFTQAAVDEPCVRIALADIRSAIRLPADTAFHSYRAVEALRQWLHLQAPPTDDRGEAWTRLRAALAITEDDLRRLAELAKEPRHGGNELISEADRLWAIRLAREALRRFVTALPQA